MKYLLILVQILLNTSAQLLLKKGVAGINFSSAFFQLIFSCITNVYIFSGILIFVISLVLWLYLLSIFELSLLYPICSLGYVFTAVGGWLFFSENLSFYRILGTVIILIGVLCVAKS